MADRMRDLQVGIHEVVIRIRRAGAGTDLMVEAPACACDDGPPPELILAVMAALDDVVHSFGGEVMPHGLDDQTGDLAPTQPPGDA